MKLTIYILINYDTLVRSLNIFNSFFKIINNKKHIKMSSTKYILCIIYDFVDNINIYFLWISCIMLYAAFALTTIF